jgi:hypothetical protein
LGRYITPLIHRIIHFKKKKNKNRERRKEKEQRKKKKKKEESSFVHDPALMTLMIIIKLVI